MIYVCMEYTPQLHIQGVSEIHVLILTKMEELTNL
jgi:hypothetical protein